MCHGINAVLCNKCGAKTMLAPVPCVPCSGFPSLHTLVSVPFLTLICQPNYVFISVNDNYICNWHLMVNDIFPPWVTKYNYMDFHAGNSLSIDNTIAEIINSKTKYTSLND